MLCTEDLSATIAFYTRILGFKCETRDDKRGWASVWHGKVNIMFSLPNAHESWRGPAFTGSLYLYTDDVDKQWGQIHEQAEVCYPLQTFDYGLREFAIYDNNRYLLKFGQTVVDSEPI